MHAHSANLLDMFVLHVYSMKFLHFYKKVKAHETEHRNLKAPMNYGPWFTVKTIILNPNLCGSNSPLHHML